jgi:cyclase
MKLPLRSLFFASGACLLGGAVALAQAPDPSKVTLRATPVVGDLSVIDAANGFMGGNVAVSSGSDGVFLVDDGLQPFTPKLKAKIATLSKKPIRFIINTHWHFDHVGGNTALGAGAVIVAHDSVRKRMSVDQTMVFGTNKIELPATKPPGLPLVTFAEDVTLHLNGDDVHVFHVDPAHTDGDVLVHFTKANVIHAGDTFINQGFPIVDVKSGGKYQGLIDAADKILALANDTTKIIPGHGPVGNKSDVATYKSLIITMRDKVKAAAAGGKTLEEVKAAKPLAEYDARFAQGPVKSDMVVEMIYRSSPMK